METFTLRDLSFFYPRQGQAALCHVSLALEQGQFITLCGKSGSGKTTLLRQLKTVLAPHGTKTGEIFFEGTPLDTLDHRIQSQKIGFVLQSPENQIVTDKVWHELAFGLESLGMDTATIRLRVAEMASFFGIQGWFHEDVAQLSGGQKQLLNLAAVMALQPSVLILDEPTSQLDPIAAADFLAAVGKINRELGVTVLLTEHRLEEALPLSDRCIVMDGGAVIADGPPRVVGSQLKTLGHEMFLAMPTPMRIYAATDSDALCPVTVREGRDWLEDYAQHTPLIPVPPTTAKMPQGPPWAIELEGVWYRYEKDAPDVVKGLSLSVCRGDFCAVVGGNGTGKTTTLGLVSGLHKPYRGTVRLEGHLPADIPHGERFGGLLGVLPQNPQALFVKKTVEMDLLEMLEQGPWSQEQQREKLQEVAHLCELESLLDRHPYDLSGGEQQRAALAKILLLEPRILLLDEPTKGLDGQFKEKLAHILHRLNRAGCTILMVSHDVEFCAKHASTCAMFFDGEIVTQGPPREFFSGNSFYTTAADRMARGVLPGAVTAEAVILACGGKVEEPVVEPAPLVPKAAPMTPPPHAALQMQAGERTLSKRTLAAAGMIFLLIPLTLFIGTAYLGDRKYAFISLLVVLETMVPFFLLFEGRKPQARELLILATLSAIAVAGRAAFFFLPNFKPVAAVVIVAAVAFGGEAGFLVGAVSMLCSNLFFGQGPWTPFQMFAMGIIGFLAGVFFRKGILRRSRIALCLYGGGATLVIYGIIMNSYSVFQVQANVTWEMLVTSCLIGLPVDLVHAASTIIFLALAGPAMLEKLDRIKIKYGLLDEPKDFPFSPACDKINPCEK